MNQYYKKFREWFVFKEKLDTQQKAPPFFYEREMWWCALGENIGVEINGKNTLFERPILIIKVFNSDALLILPITSKEKIGIYYYQFINQRKNILNGEIEYIKNSLILSQIRFISSKRLLRKIGVMGKGEFKQIKTLLRDLL